MKVAQELEKINLSTNPSKELWQFFQDSEFIDETLEVLDSDNLAHKKAYFIDNQSEVMDTLENLRNCLPIVRDAEVPSEEETSYTNLFKLISITIKRLEEGIGRFNEELTSGVSQSSSKDEIVVSEDTIKDAMQNNETTMKIAKDLRNPRKTEIDERTAQIQKDFEKLSQQKHMAQRQQSIPYQNQKPSMVMPAGYLIASQDLSDFKIVSGANLSKDVLNKMIERSGIDNARVFQLNEIPTKQKTIQKTVTVIG